MSLLDALLTGSGTPLGGAAPPAVSANTEGTSDHAARRDHTHAHGSLAGGSNHSVATTSVHGFHSATDKTNHDTVWSHVVYLKPSGDTSGATDRAAINTALAAGSCVQLLPGVFYKDATPLNLASLYGQWVKGMGPRVTILVDVGARGDGTGRMVNLDAAVQCEIADLEVHMTVTDWFAYATINPGQPTGLKITNVNVYGLSAGTIYATSSLNMTPVVGSVTVTGTSAAGYPTGSRVLFVSRGSMAQQGGTVTSNGVSGTLACTIDDARNIIAATSAVSFTPGSGSKTFTGTSTAPFANGSRVIVKSRGSSATMTGLVTSSSGDLVATIDGFTGVDPHTDWDIYGGHTDWDIRRPCRGIYASGNRIIIRSCWFSALSKNVHFQGAFGSKVLDCWYSSGSTYETPYSAGGTSSNCKFEVGTEPTYNGWQSTIDLDQTIACKIEFDTGDGGSVGGGEFIRLSGDAATDITGTLWSTSGDPLIKVNGSESLTVHDCFVATAGSALVDFGYGSSSPNPAIYGHKYFGTVGLGALTGGALSGNYYLEDSNGKAHVADALFDAATISFLQSNRVTVGNGSTTGSKIDENYGLINYSLVYDRQSSPTIGAGTDLFFATANIRISGPVADFALNSVQGYLSGQRHRVFVNVAYKCTITHNYSGEADTTKRFNCPQGVNLVSDGTVGAWFDMQWNGTNWDVFPGLGFEGGYSVTVVAHGAMGAAETLDLRSGRIHTGTLDADCTLTITPPIRASSGTIYITQDSTPRAVTFPTALWPNTVAVQPSSVSGSVNEYAWSWIPGQGLSLAFVATLGSV